MRFFHEEGQPAVRAAAVVVIGKGMYVAVGKRNYPTIEFQTFDLDEAIMWKYETERERDEAFEAVMRGDRTRKVP